MSFSWEVLADPPGFGTSTMLLLTDGRVICQEDGTANWSALTPDAHGSYKNGTWAAIAPMASWRRYYASAVLANGNVLVAGGEDAPTGDTNDCEIYDPVADSWTVIAPPGGWPNIGDAPCAVLDDGRVLLGNINTTQTVIYDPVANAWTGTGTKGDISSEETWTLLRDGSVLTVECNPTYPKASQRYVPSLGAWVDAGSTQADLVAQLQSERKMTAGMAVSYDAFYQVDRMRKLLALDEGHTTGSAASADVSAAAQALDKRLAVIADGGFGAANRDLARHLEDADFGDMLPTPSDLAATEASCRQLASAVTEFRELQTTSAPRLNAMLVRARLASLPLDAPVVNAGCESTTQAGR